ncbi:MAG: CocE/NonD family hydrolase, partial [Caldilineaceae bacterium]|nr:CocE/NonD family hydrolase [Caldilineaceae bacterium]
MGEHADSATKHIVDVVTTILTEKNIMVPMRDGVQLATDIYRPADGAPTPVLMARTPYNKDGILGGNVFDIMAAVQAGYTVVVQDVRGRYGSEGLFNPHIQETADGVDVFAWAAAQPWSNGRIGTFGGSYLGGTQLLPAREQPPALQAIAPCVAFSEGYEGCSYQGGAKVLHDLRWVVANIVPGEIARRVARGETPLATEMPLDVDGAFAELPLATHPLIQAYAPFYREWLTHRTADDYNADDYWQQSSVSTHYEQITTPALLISGWYDIFPWSTLQNFMCMRARAGLERARRHTRVLIGPWTHMNFSGSFPEREFGPNASSAAIDLAGLHMHWFDRWLKDEANGVDEEPPVTIFVMGVDEWRTADNWPLPNTDYCPYYLHSNGAANTLHGDGTLSTEPPTAEPADLYLYNPLRPVPTVGGQVILPGANAMGPRDQREVELRDDVLVYSTPVLEAPVEVIGPVALHLFISSSARDTDFTGKLVDVFPDGRAIILTEGILRARYRNSFTEPELLEPDEIYEIRLDLWATANVFLPGHRIRLEVSSSNFPRFDRNSNTGGDLVTETAEHYR